MKSTTDMSKGARANQSQTSEGERRQATNEERTRREKDEAERQRVETASKAEASKAQVEQSQGKTTELAREQDKNRESQPDVMKDESGKPMEAAPSTNNREQTVPEPAGRDGEMQLRRAAGEGAVGGLHLVNRENYPVRVTFETIEKGDQYRKGSTLELRANDTTAISLEEGDRVVLDRV